MPRHANLFHHTLTEWLKEPQAEAAYLQAARKDSEDALRVAMRSEIDRLAGRTKGET